MKVLKEKNSPMKARAWLAICILFAYAHTMLTAQAQGPGVHIGSTGSVSSQGNVSGVVARRGTGANPNLTPPGSLSLYQRLHPAGSISPGLNLNPKGSAFRPRISAGTVQPKDRKGSTSQPQASLAIPSAEDKMVVGQQWKIISDQALHSLFLLEHQLSRYENGNRWKKALRIDQVKQVLQTDDAKDLTKDQLDLLNSTLNRFELLKFDSHYTSVTQLRGFVGLDRGLTGLISSRNSVHSQIVTRSDD